jgi:hypothetical protein
MNFDAVSGKLVTTGVVDSENVLPKIDLDSGVAEVISSMLLRLPDLDAFGPIELPNMPGVGLTDISLHNSDGNLLSFFYLDGIGSPDFSEVIDIGTGVFDQLPDGLTDNGKGNRLPFLADDTLLHARPPLHFLQMES